ncbi:MAG: hypothetical protein CVV64_07055 [Candidatus Wallbacteria bacterium HGW-Wallbacteria-1]|jgi:hypothetical protein|uniref:Uncharacterized protein n=1 Tax=Candidatus Wallbacteria bacterium HGW-Wallbacteria-1 TaxID=2013854 RepID=A0A2N1PT38_9BACT|nr:MAG: hypothetical protein CVV64_07055 [Candidatus Wallbacteria bacterium HGW-Wallbacteria-1]
MGQDSRKSAFLIFLAAAVAAILLYFVMAPSSRRSTVTPADKGDVPAELVSSEGEKDKGSEVSIGSARVPFDKVDFSGLTLEEKANIAAARHYEARKEALRARNAPKRRVKEAFYSSGGTEIARAKELIRKGDNRTAINVLLEALRKTNDSPTAKMAVHRYLAQSYEKVGDVPKYCLNMYKYLSMAESSTKDEDRLEQIRIFKAQLKESIDKFKSAGVASDE